ncbi:uroporphyrinogen-III synthase [Paraferrimonas haliotis]|uniref:Uroporphyrinogen-III synthase n=1 Tax=Paraferrimonas haliotis TaxID=2013866 RepID=A0AA37TUW3_9GAMM|nr:uroporphyrinogen-III synthase [Paraferrimonas haliotis]GLS82241.1 uroporphyrinogen III methyltransferase [Paraferrimonas haliotis]
MPKSLLLTRPKGRNHSLQQQLASMGVRTSVAPMLEIQANPDSRQYTPAQLANWADKIIFISTNAVEFAKDLLQIIGRTQVQCLAVGLATQAKLSEYGILAETAPEHLQQTEGLLDLSSLQDVAEQRIVIVRGNGGRETLAQELQQRGAEVRYWQVYQRGVPECDINSLCQHWRQQQIDTIVITSGEALQNLRSQVQNNDWQWLAQLHFIVPSERVMDMAQGMGIQSVVNAQGANDKAVIEAVKQLKGEWDERQQNRGQQ